MLNSDQEFLLLFGWDDFFANQTFDLDSHLLTAARVICEERNLYRVQMGMNLVFWASISGKMQFNAKARVDYPAVGDWVMVEQPPQSERVVIHRVLERKTIIHRKQAGLNPDLQILSANADFTFITSSANSDLNFRRIERYLAITQESGVKPVILLTKSDICLDPIEEIVAEVEKQFPGIPVCSLSKENFEESHFLEHYLRQGTTSVFIGSSGVGKSTLVNFLIGKDLVRTQEIRKDDEKGRHTTTSRQLYVSRYGGLIIDTPGMRELQLSDHSEGLSSQFSEIEVLMSACRFGDCRHDTEPGCAIRKSLEEGSLSEERWRSYQKLEAEIRHSLRKSDKVLAAEEKKKWKKISVDAREISRSKKGRGRWD